MYPLLWFDAREVCGAIIDLFMHTGIATVISSDNASNFVNKLTQEFEARLECSPRFNTSGHPEGPGVCERWNACLKNALHHALRESQREWHKVILYIVWAYREVSNNTTGVAPYMVLYGRLPKGSLAILKDSWAGELELPPNLGKSVAACLQELKENLEIAADIATKHAKAEQASYTEYYNRSTKDKHFNVGKKVLVLASDSSNKIYSRWHGPCTITQVRAPCSYVVDMGNGTRQHLHANKVVRTHLVGIIK